MDPIFSQHAPATPPGFPASPQAAPTGTAVPAARSRDRIDRLAALTPEDNSAGLIWLALHLPAACDAMLDALEYDDEEEEASPEPEPYCATCGAGVGIFVRSGLEWRHFGVSSRVMMRSSTSPVPNRRPPQGALIMARAF